MSLRISYATILLALILAGACTSDDEASGSFGSLKRNAELGELDTDQSMALCDATIELREGSTAEGDARRGGCMAEIFSEIRAALFNVESDPDNYSLDAVTEDCEAALDRCLDEGPTVLPCTSLTFDSSCHATVGDYEQCIAGGADVTAMIASSDCETFVNSEDERDRVTDVLQGALDSCTDELSACEGILEPPPDEDRTWFEGGLAEIGLTGTPVGSPDTSSNEEWLDEFEALVDGYPRPDCDVVLERDAEVDAAAAEIAAAPFGEVDEVDLDTAAEWKWVSADYPSIIKNRMTAFMLEQRDECGWARYGLAVDGEPGENRAVVVMLAE